MLFDTHTNLMWYPDHLSDEFVQFAWEAKRAKMKLTKDVYFAGSSVQEQNAFDSRPEELLAVTADSDKVIVFGIKARFTGINADQELIAKFVQEHSDRFIGWCSVDPNDRDCVEQLEYYVNHLGLRFVRIDVQQAANAARQAFGNRNLRSTQQWDGTHAERSSRFGRESRCQVARSREYGRRDLVELAFQTIGTQQLHEQLASCRQNLRLLIGGHAGGPANTAHCHRKTR